MTHTITIHTSHFKQLNKRLLLQPLTLKAVETPDGCRVTYKDNVGKEALLTHVLAFANDTLVATVIDAVFCEKGAYPDWARSRLVPRLATQDRAYPWDAALKQELAYYLSLALLDEKPFKLDAYLQFSTAPIRAHIYTFASELEELTFYGAIERTLSIISVDAPIHDVPTAHQIEIVGSPTDMVFLLEQDASGMQREIVNTADFEADIANLYAETLYKPDSTRYKEAQFYTYTLMMMARWNIRQWVVPEELFETLETYRSRLDIPIVISKKE